MINEIVKNKDSEAIIKCDNCGQILISGKSAILIFGLGTSITCRVCGNKYTFTEKDRSLAK